MSVVGRLNRSSWDPVTDSAASLTNFDDSDSDTSLDTVVPPGTPHDPMYGAPLVESGSRRTGVLVVVMLVVVGALVLSAGSAISNMVVPHVLLVVAVDGKTSARWLASYALGALAHADRPAIAQVETSNALRRAKLHAPVDIWATPKQSVEVRCAGETQLCAQFKELMDVALGTSEEAQQTKSSSSASDGASDQGGRHLRALDKVADVTVADGDSPAPPSSGPSGPAQVPPVPSQWAALAGESRPVPVSRVVVVDRLTEGIVVKPWRASLPVNNVGIIAPAWMWSLIGRRARAANAAVRIAPLPEAWFEAAGNEIRSALIGAAPGTKRQDGGEPPLYRFSCAEWGTVSWPVYAQNYGTEYGCS